MAATSSSARGSEVVYLAGEVVDLGEQDPGQLSVVIIELPGERLDQGGVLDPHPAAGQPGQDLRPPSRASASAETAQGRMKYLRCGLKNLAARTCKGA
jgi:hypothetical protein